MLPQYGNFSLMVFCLRRQGVAECLLLSMFPIHCP